MKALFHGQVIAESDKTLEVGGYVYFPRDAVRMELFKAAPKDESDKACPHGVQFYDIIAGKNHGERQAWSYEKPGASLKQVDHWFGFWDEVEVL